jgi:hypothetical protein
MNERRVDDKRKSLSSLRSDQGKGCAGIVFLEVIRFDLAFLLQQLRGFRQAHY